jgi:hypothetical protein
VKDIDYIDFPYPFSISRSLMSFLLPFICRSEDSETLEILSSEPHCYAPREATVTGNKLAEFLACLKG